MCLSAHAPWCTQPVLAAQAMHSACRLARGGDAAAAGPVLMRDGPGTLTTHTCSHGTCGAYARPCTRCATLCCGTQAAAKKAPKVLSKEEMVALRRQADPNFKKKQQKQGGPGAGTSPSPAPGMVTRAVKLSSNLHVYGGRVPEALQIAIGKGMRAIHNYLTLSTASILGDTQRTSSIIPSSLMIARFICVHV